MSDFDWEAHEKVEPTKFNWDDHEIVGHDGMAEPEKADMAQSSLEHFGNGAALGYLPHMQAAVERGVDMVGEAKDKALDMVGLDHLASIDHQLRQQGYKLPDESYLAARDANIKRLAKEAKDNPITTKAAGLGGAVATGIASSAIMPARAATALGRVRQAAMIGGGTGVAVNPGDTPGVIDPIQLKERAVNGLIGAGTAGALQGTAEGLTSKPVISAANSFGKKLTDLASAVRGEAPAEVAAAPAALSPNSPAANGIKIDPFTKQWSDAPVGSAPPSAEGPAFDPFTKKPFTPSEAPSSGGPYFKPGDALPTAIKYGPKVIGGALGGFKGYAVGEGISRAAPAALDKASKFLMQTPKFAELATKSPQAFKALAADFATKLGPEPSGPNQAPVDDEKARQAFLSGN